MINRKEEKALNNYLNETVCVFHPEIYLSKSVKQDKNSTSSLYRYLKLYLSTVFEYMYLGTLVNYW